MNTRTETNIITPAIFSPIYAYLIEDELYETLTKNPANAFFNWQSATNDQPISRIADWHSNDIINGKLDARCQQLLNQNIQPVVVVQPLPSELRGDPDWAEKFNEFSQKFEMAIEFRMVMDIYDDAFLALRDELFLPDKFLGNAWDRIASFRRTKGLKLWFHLPNQMIFDAYGDALQTWLKSHETFDDPARPFENDEFEYKQHGEEFLITQKDFQCNSVVGSFDQQGKPKVSKVRGFLSQQFAENIAAQVFDKSSEFLDDMKGFFSQSEAWVSKKNTAHASSSDESKSGMQEKHFKCKNPEFELILQNYEIDPEHIALTLRVPNNITAHTITITFDEKPPLILSLNSEDKKTSAVFCSVEEVNDDNEWIALIALSTAKLIFENLNRPEFSISIS